MLNYRRINSCILLTIVVSHCLLHTLAYPQSVELPRRLSSSSRQEQDNQQQQQQQQLQQPQQQQQQLQPSSDERSREARKFAVKPNAQKKVALDDIDDDIEGNQIQESSGSVGGSGLSGLGGFSWSNMLSAFFSMLFNNAGNAAPTKSDDADNSVGFGGSPWANVISVGLKIVNTLLGGGAPSDGIDKVDNGGSPMQGILAAVLSSVLGTKDPEQVNSMAKQAGEFIQIVMNLLDALKTSFSHRSLAARSLGKRDSVSDATVAGIAMLKGYVRTYRNADEKCMQRYMCDANTECVREIGGASIFCQLGSYATSFVLGRTTGSQFEPIYDAGRRGRSGFDCNQLYLECNEV